MPILFTKVYGIREALNANIVKLDDFVIANECGDTFTMFNSIDAEVTIHEGLRRTNKLFVTMWIVTGFAILELTLCAFVSCAAILKVTINEISCEYLGEQANDFITYYKVLN